MNYKTTAKKERTEMGKLEIVTNKATNVHEIHRHGCKDIATKVTNGSTPCSGNVIPEKYLEIELEEMDEMGADYKVFNCVK